MVKGLLRFAMISLVVLLITILVAGATLGGGAFALLYQFNQNWDQTKLRPAYNTIIYDNQHKPIAELHGAENRKPISAGDLPEHVRQAFIATEDRRFFEHRGVDLRGILRALYVNYQKGYLAQGGSTISQQLARNAFLNQEKTWTRKVKEALLAIELERRYSKTEILTMYLNRIYFGHGAYGVESAAQLYFNKHIWDVTPAEAALLAGIPKHPASYSPYRHPEAAKLRQGTVLERMVAAGFIDSPTRDKLWKQKVYIKGISSRDLYQHPYFVDHVITEVSRRFALQEQDLYEGGYQIYTTMDPGMQQSMEQVLSQARYYPSPATEQEPVQGAMAVVGPKHGYILGLVGGRDYQVRRGYNRATQMHRQPGSAIKPLAVYAPAVELGYGPGHVLSTVAPKLGGWQADSGAVDQGPMTMEAALTHSVNGYAVNLLLQIGIEQGHAFATQLGLPLVEKDKVPALALGGLTYGCSPLELAAAYASFANDGKYLEPIAVLKVVDPQGQELAVVKAQRQGQVMQPATARIMTGMLTKVVEAGTGQEARLERSVAGKTGTNGDKDAWFVGYTQLAVGAVWMGYDTTTAGRYLQDVYGGTYPARAWKSVMQLGLPQLSQD